MKAKRKESFCLLLKTFGIINGKNIYNKKMATLKRKQLPELAMTGSKKEEHRRREQSRRVAKKSFIFALAGFCDQSFTVRVY